jgi:hypothetical protein
MSSTNIKIDFAGLVRMYHAQALIYLGTIKNPVTDKMEKNLDQAQLLIDILLLLKEKTVNNLASEEHTMLENSLARLTAELQKEMN